MFSFLFVNLFWLLGMFLSSVLSILIALSWVRVVCELSVIAPVIISHLDLLSSRNVNLLKDLCIQSPTGSLHFQFRLYSCFQSDLRYEWIIDLLLRICHRCSDSLGYCMWHFLINSFCAAGFYGDGSVLGFSSSPTSSIWSGKRTQDRTEPF